MLPFLLLQAGAAPRVELVSALGLSTPQPPGVLLGIIMRGWGYPEVWTLRLIFGEPALPVGETNPLSGQPVGGDFLLGPGRRWDLDPGVGRGGHSGGWGVAV